MELHSCPARPLIITFFPLIWRSQDLHLDATSSRPQPQLPGQRCKECAVISQLKNIWKIFTIHRAHSTLNLLLKISPPLCVICEQKCVVLGGFLYIIDCDNRWVVFDCLKGGTQNHRKCDMIVVEFVKSKSSFLKFCFHSTFKFNFSTEHFVFSASPNFVVTGIVFVPNASEKQISEMCGK